MIRLESQVRRERSFLGRREDADIALRILVAAGDAERRSFVPLFRDDVHGSGGREVAEMRKIGPFVYFHSIDSFRDQPMKIGIPLAMGMADDINGNAINKNGEIRAMVGVEAAEKDLISLAAAVMLANDQPRR